MELDFITGLWICWAITMIGYGVLWWKTPDMVNPKATKDDLEVLERNLRREIETVERKHDAEIAALTRKHDAAIARARSEMDAVRASARR